MKFKIPRELMDHREFLYEFDHLHRGDWLEYYRGFLYRDRHHRTPQGRTLDAVASLAWQKYVTGQAVLVQKRHGDNDYSYYVVKRRDAMELRAHLRRKEYA